MSAPAIFCCLIAFLCPFAIIYVNTMFMQRTGLLLDSGLYLLDRRKGRLFREQSALNRSDPDTGLGYPSATSSTIINAKPSAAPMVPMLLCSPACASGISSSTTT